MCDWYDSLLDFPERFIWIGPCSPSFDKKEYTFTDTSKFEKTVFLSNGTHVLWAKERMIKIAENLGKSYPDICFIVSSGDYSKKDEEVKKISENVYVYKYIDYENGIAPCRLCYTSRRCGNYV